MIQKRNYDTKRPPEKDMIFGMRAVMEALDAGKTIDKILLRRDMSSALGRELMQKLEGRTVPVQRVPVERLNQYTDKNHQGVIAFLSPVEFYRVEDVVPALFEAGKTPLLMVLDGVTDVRNFGAIARTCVCAGADAIVIAARSGVAVNGDAVKTSAGALHTLPVCKVDNMQECLRYLADSGLRLVAATEHTERNYTSADMTAPLAIVMGSEEHGIYEPNLQLCTDRVRIPMSGTIESLNVSVAAGVMLYEAVRQRGGVEHAQ
ncbi:MAG: 23S rRNA (guanosine(2251)-2'-O)-methyltransferase RlmB [Paludibacteraceae bacterium]|nr:23S rRNA (guanosine(2251)-2'-O)-methyltransferase RlmB [Paludibacteraceae bacterium]MBR1481214.1 23S rRNA (guanosine(2251)-2'-O)-methyltransferase RlmB [Paludibacteraceae bacterium]